MSGIRLLDLVKPFSSLLPEVELPYEKVVFDEKIVYTIGVAAIYLLTSIPINGVRPDKMADPFDWLRLPLASESGTLLELGVLPLVTSAFLWQILAGLKIIKVNFASVQDRQLFQSLQKISSILFALAYSVLLVFSGYFQNLDSFTRSESPFSGSALWSNLLIVVQLTVGSAVLTLLVEFLEKGYGFGPGILAFIAVTSATKFSGSIAGIATDTTSKGFESHGAVVQLIRNFFGKPFGYAIQHAFNRADLANLTQVYTTIIVILLIVYLSNYRMEISIKSSKVRSMVSVYPIRLFYCGALPLLFTYSILYNLNIFGFCLTRIFGNLEFLGTWQLDGFSNRTYQLTSGFLYLLSPSTSGATFVLKIVRPFTFVLFVIIVSTLFGKNWFYMSGSAGKDLSKQFKEQDIVVVGHRDATIARELNKTISTASTTGAFVLSSIAALGEVVGFSKGLTIGSVTGVMCSLSLLEQIMSEYQQTGSANSQFSQVFGA